MITTTVREFLKKPLIARFSTIDPAGYPHTVPVWFDLDGDDIVVISVSDTRKVGYLRANPKAAITIGGDKVGNAARDTARGLWIRRQIVKTGELKVMKVRNAQCVDIPITSLQRLQPGAYLTRSGCS